MTENLERQADRAERQRLAMEAYLAEEEDQPSVDRPKPPAGWYPHPSMAQTVRYWDGQAWTDHIAPATAAAPAAAQPALTGQTRACPYCAQGIAPTAQRCPHCSGELRYRPKCKINVGTTSRQKFVGVLRGGMKTAHSCMHCGKVLDGPRF